MVAVFAGLIPLDLFLGDDGPTAQPPPVVRQRQVDRKNVSGPDPERQLPLDFQSAKRGADGPPIQKHRTQQHSGQNNQQIDFFDDGHAEHQHDDRQIIPTLAANGRSAVKHGGAMGKNNKGDLVYATDVGKRPAAIVAIIAAISRGR
jgi:hypothetical protein